MSFDAFLQKLGMTQQQYMFALKGAVRHTFLILPKRDCRDVFINNYNPRILSDDPSNHDVQVIDEEEGAYSVASYVAKYISKLENAQSKLLQAIEEQSCRDGDSSDLKLKKLAKVLDDTRDVSMQEVIYRLFGYHMCAASRKTKFIQTQAPEKRDALLKPNIDDLNEDDDVFCHNIIDYYQCRPDSLQNLTLAAFAADYDYSLHSRSRVASLPVDGDANSVQVCPVAARER